MEQDKKMPVRSISNSIRFALNGIKLMFKSEPNAKLHAVATVIVVAFGILRHINNIQWTAILFAIGMVWVTEALNTCIEKLCDFSCENKIHPAIKTIKDIAAGAVLIAAIVSVTIAVFVFTM